MASSFTRLLSTVNTGTLKAANLRVTLCQPDQRKAKPTDPNAFPYGKLFSDHLLSIKWTQTNGWNDPEIIPFQNFTLHPATKAIHYAQSIYEGTKAFRGVDGKIRLFRPELNMARFLRSAERASLASFDPDELLKCLKKLIAIDADWVPSGELTSLYIRPVFMGTEPALGINPSNESHLFVILSPVGCYFGTKITPVSLYADPLWVRAWPGGAGSYKLSANYAPTLSILNKAREKGCQSVLWLYGDDHQITEVDAMNVFVYLINDQGEKELVTPPLDQDIILPGINRNSLLALARDWNQFKVSERIITMKEVCKAHEENRLLEMFGAGTAAVVCPIGRINYENKDYYIPYESGENVTNRLRTALTDIQYGKTEYKNWTQIVC